MADAVAALEAVFGSSRDHVVAFDAAGEVTYRNAPARERELDTAVAREVLGRVLATGVAEGFAWGERGPGGVRWWYTAELSPYDRGAVCVSRDVTAAKRGEERLRRSEQMLVDTQGVAHLGTWEWDITQTTATWSAELYRIYGVTPATYTPSYEAYLTMVHPDDRQRVIDATNRVFREHVPYSHDERIVRPDGTLRYLHTWAFPVLDDAGVLTHLAGVCQDITDRALAEAALHEVEGFSTMAAHDLRGPLAVLQMGVDLLARDTGLAPGSQQHLERCRRAIASMTGRLDDLLAFARVGQVALEPAPLDVSALAAELIAEHRASAPDRAVDVAIEPGLHVTADPALFRVALGNLISNAWKYTAQAAPARIEIGQHEHRLFVRDNGVGFDMADAGRLFRPFQRLRTAVPFTGTGIGLATVAAIVHRHGGRVSADAQVGTGATFYVSLGD